MSNRITLILAALVLGLGLADLLWLQSGAALFLLKKLADLVEYLAFWR